VVMNVGATHAGQEFRDLLGSSANVKIGRDGAGRFTCSLDVAVWVPAEV